jgi:hypothetical protein
VVIARSRSRAFLLFSLCPGCRARQQPRCVIVIRGLWA